MHSNHPIFLHSLWRSSSTYLFKVFRENARTYCFYEPYNIALEKVTIEDIQARDYASWDSGHPRMKPYWLEFLPLVKIDGGIERYKAEFSEVNYFPIGDLPEDEKLYLLSLQELAHKFEKIPIFCFCRSLCRAGQIRKIMKGTHIVQYRNPHHILASCIKVSFSSIFPHIFGLAREKSLPAALQVVPPLHDDKYYNPHSIDAHETFFHFFVLSTVAGVFYADIVLDTDLLAHDAAYKTEFENSVFERTGVALNCSEVNLPDPNSYPVYSHQIFTNVVDRYIGSTSAIEHFKDILEQLSGLRVTASISQIENLRDHWLNSYQSAFDFTIQTKYVETLEHASRMTEIVRKEQIHANCAAADELAQVYASYSWKITRPLRAIKKFLNRIIRYITTVVSILYDGFQ